MSKELVSRTNLSVRVLNADGSEAAGHASALREFNEDHYIDAALRSSRTNEVFIFCFHTYLVITYDPTSPGKGQRVVKGPLLMVDGFPNLYGSSFCSNGVDAAFGCHGVNQAYLFSNHLCVKVEYGPHIRMGNMIEAIYPEDVESIFPCLESIGFSCCLDAAFESTTVGEAYLFKGSNYALINYNLKTLISTGLITDAFPCLLNTEFAADIKAAFASHLPNQAYLFKRDNCYMLIRYTPGSGDPNDSYIISGPDEMVPSNWPALQDFVPYKRWSKIKTPQTWTPVWRRIKFGGVSDGRISDSDSDSDSDSEFEPDVSDPYGPPPMMSWVVPPIVRL